MQGQAFNVYYKAQHTELYAVVRSLSKKEVLFSMECTLQVRVMYPTVRDYKYDFTFCFFHNSMFHLAVLHFFNFVSFSLISSSTSILDFQALKSTFPAHTCLVHGLSIMLLPFLIIHPCHETDFQTIIYNLASEQLLNARQSSLYFFWISDVDRNYHREYCISMQFYLDGRFFFSLSLLAIIAMLTLLLVKSRFKILNIFPKKKV